MLASEDKDIPSEWDEEEKRVIAKAQSLPELAAAMAILEVGLKKYQPILHEFST